MILWLAVTAALAHPFGNSSASHRSELWLGSETVSLRYTAEVPADVVRANARLRPGSDPVAVTTSELVSGLVLAVDGVAVPLNVVGPARITPEQGAYTIAISFSAPLPQQGAGIVELSNANLPEVRSYWSCAVMVDRQWVVLDASVLQGGRDTCPEWRTGDASRTLTLSLRRTSPGERARDWLLDAPDTRGLLAARPQPMQWRSGTLNGPALIAMPLATAALAGLGDLRPNRALLGWAVALVVAIGASFLPFNLAPWLDLVFAVLVAIGARWPRWGTWTGIAALASTGHSLRLVALLAGVAGMTALVRHGLLRGPSAGHLAPEDALDRTKLAAHLLWLVAGWLLIRGLLGLLSQT